MLSRQPVPRYIQIDLMPGQTLEFHAEAGTLLHLLSGEVTLQPSPVWLAEIWVSAAQNLRGGDVHRLAYQDWFTLQARQRTQLLCISPIAVAQPWARWLGGIRWPLRWLPGPGVKRIG